jgi:gamma-glutamyl:cysteine ligase YbdK (ATP-grasp superfamily)
VIARDWIAAELEAMAPLAAELGLQGVLVPVQQVLSQGNQAMQWLAAHADGASVAALVADGAAAMAALEVRLNAGLATDRADTLG